MTEELVERLAKAMWENPETYGRDRGPWDEDPLPMKAGDPRLDFIKDARACLAEIEAAGYAIVPRAALDEVLAHDFVDECQECGVGQTDGWQALKAAAKREKEDG